MGCEQIGYRKSSRVWIIGAGISGIAAAKQLSHHNPIVLEATHSIGGVWKHCSFPSTKLQTPRCDLEFSDYPWPERDNSSFHSYLEILEYLHGYAMHFDVLKYVRFGSKVVEIRYVSDGLTANSDGPGDFGPLLSGHPAWEVAVEIYPSKTCMQLGIGQIRDIPRMPSFPPNKGREIYGGKVMHTIEYSKLDKEAARELLKGKKVAVVGYKKSAIDLATECAEANEGSDGQPSTMVIRTLHWTVPCYWIWGLSFSMFIQQGLLSFSIADQTKGCSGICFALFCLLW
ncbi:putative flavin-containing monooxygenase 1 [Hibiscus syriacus]|uniref:Flavin-containing monooxygenase n=1 Tax=Hibiscus syriacus TaxID=106335 RepID=A0A6A2XH28_HIBSY|nr:putative flavin-containing monooxygenase 1 [Hibiscus syriacus]